MFSLETLIDFIPPPNREPCFAIWKENAERFESAWGSSSNHQAWPGGYLAHVTEVMNIALALYPALESVRPLPFHKFDTLLPLYLHDIEKPWKVDPKTGEKNKALTTKADKAIFRLTKLEEYKFVLTAEQKNALKYVEGENDDYEPGRRVMNEMAAFCHMCDIASARIWFNFPTR